VFSDDRGGLDDLDPGKLRSLPGEGLAEMFTPGAMTPPSVVPRRRHEVEGVAVPKSTTMAGRWCFVNTATALTIRSAPTSFGLSILMGDPRLDPGPTIIGVRPKYRSHSSMMVG